jgi:hypothetical protein
MHFPEAQFDIPHWRAFSRICLSIGSVGLIVISVQPYRLVSPIQPALQQALPAHAPVPSSVVSKN